jgi:hypothetical protein
MSDTQDFPMDQSGASRDTVPQYRDPTQAPLRKLTVDLIKTYRSINDVSIIGVCCGKLVDITDHFSMI